MPKINMTKFRTDVQRAKEGLGLTQRQLGAQTGLGHAALSRLFCGKMKRPTYKTFNVLCAALGLEREDYFPAASSDIEKTHEAAKATLARANALLDGVQEKIDELKARAAEDTPEPDYGEDEPEPREAGQTVEDRLKLALHTVETTEQALLSVSRERDDLAEKLDAATKEQKETELEFINVKNEIAELKNALDIKNRSVAEKSRLVDSLTIDLRADDKLILALLEFVNRLKDGDVAR